MVNLALEYGHTHHAGQVEAALEARALRGMVGGMIAEIISVGTELTTGAVTDTNSGWLSRRLAEVGAPVVRHTTVDDDRGHLRDAIRDAIRRYDLVIINGGLGPTRDDITRFALADAMEQPLERAPAALAQIEAFFARLGRKPSDADAVQALAPRTSAIIENPVGTAPGIEATIGKCRVFCLPGVPPEMKRMFETVADRLGADRAPAASAGIAVRVLHTFGTYESRLGERIAPFMDPGRNPAVGTTASEGVISIRIVARADWGESGDALADADVRAIRETLGDLVFGAGADTLASVLAAALTERALTISTAESCTGGLLAKSLTDIPGSSAYLLRGYVTYSNEAKVELLGVPAALIEEHGAVSEAVARAMAVGCLQRSATDLAVSITGIAGPTGGTERKPVGLVFVGLARGGEAEVRRYRFGDHLSREAIRDRSCKAALNQVRLALLTE